MGQAARCRVIRTRPVPRWRRYPPRQLALGRLLEAVLDERTLWPASTAVHRALGRAERAIQTATREADSPSP